LGGQIAVGFKSNKVKALLAYLCTESSNVHSRESLAGLLWPHQPNSEALSNLRFALSTLRSVIGDRTAEPPYLTITRESIAFNRSSDYWLDIEEWTWEIEKSGDNRAKRASLEQAIALYRGSFLDGFYIEDSPAFDEWVLVTRERFSRQQRSNLHACAEICEEQGDNQRAINLAWMQLEFEPWDESAHRQLMRLMVATGQRNTALAQYESCRNLLKKELGVDPSEETIRLYERIRSGIIKPTGSSSSPVAALQPILHIPDYLHATAASQETPLFVARRDELEKLKHYLDLALNGQGQVVFIIGEAGSGKSSLIHEFSRQAQAMVPDLCVASGSCNAYTGVGDPFSPFREILELLSGGIEARLAAGAISNSHALKLWSLLPITVRALIDVGPDLIDSFISRSTLLDRSVIAASGHADWLSELDDFLEGKPTTIHAGSGSQQVDLFEQYTRVIITLAQTKPLLITLDDLQWSDLGSISLLFHLGRHLGPSRVMLIGAYRPEDIALAKEGARNALERLVNEFQHSYGDITVNLDLAEGSEFIRIFLETEPNHLTAAFRQQLYRHTRGHPLFTVETMRGLQERGEIIKAEDGYWVEGQSLDWMALPARVEAAIRERIARLPDDLYRLLVVASVEGEDFIAEVVADILGVDEREIVQRLSNELIRKHRLVNALAIQRVGSRRLSRYRFRNYLFQKFIYESLDEAERAYLHEDVGNSLENLFGEQSSEIALQLARHYQVAGIPDKAIHYLFLAGQKALLLSAYQEARTHLNQAIAILESLPDSDNRADQELELQLALGWASMKNAPHSERIAAYSRAYDLCLKLGDTATLSHVLGDLATYHYTRAEYSKAIELCQESLALARQTEDPVILAVSHWCYGFVSFGLGDYVSSRNHLEQMISTYRPEQHRDLLYLRGTDAGLSAIAYNACSLWCLGYPDQAARCSQQALAMAQDIGHPFSTLDVYAYAGIMLYAIRQDGQLLKEIAEEQIRLAQESDFPGWLGTAVWSKGAALILLGQSCEGIALLQEGIEIDKANDVKLFLPGAMGFLCRGYIQLGQVDQAMNTIQEALSLVKQTGEGHWEAELNRIYATLLRLTEDDSEAEACLLKSIKIARHTAARSWELRSSIDLYCLWCSKGKVSEANHLLTNIYDWFTEGHATKDLTTARDLLALTA